MSLDEAMIVQAAGSGLPDRQKVGELASRYNLTFVMEWAPALKAKYGLKLLGE